MKSMFSVDFVELNFIAHDFFAELSVLLLSGHILFSLYHSESIRGIIYGKVGDQRKNGMPTGLFHQYLNRFQIPTCNF
jgi:cytochrome b subunit of formate dehydrogenase